MRQKNNISKNRSGMTIVEVLIAVFILLPILGLGMQTFVKCMELSDMAKNSSLAVWGVKKELAAIENTTFNQIYTTYHNATFTIPDINGIGKVAVDNTVDDHVIVHVSFSWQERRGRVMGEDKNLNGVLNAGEDANGNGLLDSTVEMTTQVYSM